MPSLKRTRDDSSGLVEPDEIWFPHELFLDEEDIEKLSAGGLKLGDERVFLAKARVTSRSENQDEDKGDRRSITLTLIEGEIKQPSKSNAERLFGGGDGGSQ